MGIVRRIYVEKKEPYAVKAKELLEDVKNYLGITGITEIKEFIRYDVEDISDEIFEIACNTVFSEPPVDLLYKEMISVPNNGKCFSVEYLPGQFDQRADSAVQCIKFLKEDEEPTIQTAVTYLFLGDITEEEFSKIKAYCINPVDSRETGMEKPVTLVSHFPEPDKVPIMDDFTKKEESDLRTIYSSLNLAMTFQDFLHIHHYFSKEEQRDPSMTEIRVLDTYWSDHCRHTTFSTELSTVEFEDGYYRAPIEGSFKKYLETREELYKGRTDKYVCLMDLALMAMKKLKKDGKLADLEESDEINACSIIVPVEIEKEDKTKETQEWIVSFKNETHNHPTEIEPFGGAATCLGGAIRDPLSGRSYVYQAMRVTGAADPTTPVENTLKGKLSQKKLVRGAAAGYSSYGNQIGLATGLVKEIYHPDYVAKRMEIGAVMGAAPRKNVIRGNSDPGDIIILLGGRTGRDGCGGATGSSKVHTEESIETCGAEVQKGNAPTERKIQRLFRREEVATLIKKCNDFGAGGVSVAIGELADGLKIDLDKVPKKYAGLDGTELAISESQERMAVVVDPKDVEVFFAFSEEENLEAVPVAVVTKEPRLVMNFMGQEIVNLSRAFLDTNGAHQETSVKVEMPEEENNFFKKIQNAEVKEALEKKDLKAAWLKQLSDLNSCSQKGLVEMFDSSIGASTVLMPYGGKTQTSETQTMVAKLPVLNGKTEAVSMMSYGFDPYLSSWSPYHGAVYAVIESMSKIVAAGGDYKKIRFTFQEYFRRMSEEPSRWSQPFAALLGAYDAQMGFELASIGGKDSMSGTFNDIDVPPTLVSFAVDMATTRDIISPELKRPGNKLVLFKLPVDEFEIPKYEKVKEIYEEVAALISNKEIVSAYALDATGIVASASKMAFGNSLGLEISDAISEKELFSSRPGDLLVEVTPQGMEKIKDSRFKSSIVATITQSKSFKYKDMNLDLEEAFTNWSRPLEKVFPTKAGKQTELLEEKKFVSKDIYICKNKVAVPTVFIPVFPGTNCEFDSAKAFKRAGANVITSVFKNQSPQDIRESVELFEKGINSSQIIMFPGGFSAGDEPDGSAKFFATAFRNERMKEAVECLLNERDGLALGICNGFQALIKLGLVPNGKICGQDQEAPTLTFNTINRHISKMVYTKVISNKSPWLQEAVLGETYVTPASHGEGRFVASKEWIETLFANGQVATRYASPEGIISMDEEFNVNGSYEAIEGITSPDGRCFGKMAHIERRDHGVARNIFGEQDMKVFESGVNYFK